MWCITGNWKVGTLLIPNTWKTFFKSRQKTFYHSYQLIHTRRSIVQNGKQAWSWPIWTPHRIPDMTKLEHKVVSSHYPKIMGAVLSEHSWHNCIRSNFVIPVGFLTTFCRRGLRGLFRIRCHSYVDPIYLILHDDVYACDIITFIENTLVIIRDTGIDVILKFLIWWKFNQPILWSCT